MKVLLVLFASSIIINLDNAIERSANETTGDHDGEAAVLSAAT